MTIDSAVFDVALAMLRATAGAISIAIAFNNLPRTMVITPHREWAYQAFNVGDKVKVHVPPTTAHIPKFAQQWWGPYEVTRVVSLDVYDVRPLPGADTDVKKPQPRQVRSATMRPFAV